ncbi:MAG: lytic transglycosylase domain-containing protein [Pseudomonadota bacterium]|nr:lytic transglycosylase domain-containing protein [Pseudomonadota bacterium]
MILSVNFNLSARIGRLFLVLIFGILLITAKFVQAEPNISENRSVNVLKAAEISGIVSQSDASRYRVIFKLQENGDWQAADKIIRRLSNKVLIGHVFAQRYLHPTKYRSGYKELKTWLDKYYDHPQAPRLYKLAIRRKPKNWKLPKKPYILTHSGFNYYGGKFSHAVYNPRKKLGRVQRRERWKLLRQLRFYLRKGWTKSYKNLIRSKKPRILLHVVELDRLKAKLGAGYYGDGRDKWAYDWSNAAIKRSGKYLPESPWVAGMAAWRLGWFDRALKHFTSVSSSVYSSPWLLTAGAFWAARASIQLGKPSLYIENLEKASAYPRTFYGILSRRLLGLEIKYNWTSPPLEKNALLELKKAPGGQRAVALLQIGMDRRAESELKILFSKARPKLARSMMALADRANMPSLAMRIGNMLVASGSSLFDSTAYPAPALQIQENQANHRALILALIRQESGFNPKAKSRRGARGLMQLMPRTASFLARDRRLRGGKKNRDKLFDPKMNLALGGKYINVLLRDKVVNGDLFRMAAAWNGGPGNLNKWLRSIKYDGDPLLFIESIPSKETRIFVERVLTNYWIYQARFENPTPSLDLIAQGKWPTYQFSSRLEIEVAEDDRKGSQ